MLVCCTQNDKEFCRILKTISPKQVYSETKQVFFSGTYSQERTALLLWFEFSSKPSKSDA